MSPAPRGVDGAAPARSKVVVIGGGTGISECLRGLRRLDIDLTAIVTVADDGGSSGRLRKDFHVPPPGDIRNCLVAMSEGDPLVAKLFSYRFPDSVLKGHSFGNLCLVVLTNLLGSFTAAVAKAGEILQVRGRVLPSTDVRVVLVASHPDGTKSTGEQCISRCGKPIVGMELRPKPPPVNPEIRDRIAEADLVVIGPGSLFSGLIPNLLVQGMAEALKSAKGTVLVVGNLMTQPGETDGFTLEDHLRVLGEVGGLQRIDAIVVNGTPIPIEIADRYKHAGAELLRVPVRSRNLLSVPVRVEDLAVVTEDGLVRHDPAKLADAMADILKNRE